MIVWSCSAQSCRTVVQHCPCPLRELEPLHEEKWSRPDFTIYGAVLLRAVDVSPRMSHLACLNSPVSPLLSPVLRLLSPV